MSREIESWAERDLLIACLWAEARGEPDDGQRAVCSVILNRVKKRMKPSIRAVILAPAQFSWTNPDDPNYSQVLVGRSHPAGTTGWQRATGIADEALAGTLSDNTRNADHYLNVELTRSLRGGSLPDWAQSAIDHGRVTVKIGHHTFLNLRG